MPSQSCTHIKVTGVRCDSPALRGEQFCYFHQRMHRGVRTPPQARLHPVALIEDEESIQAALMEVINALMRNTIDLKRAALILRALHIAVKNAGRVKIGVESRSAVTEIPDYAQPAPAQVETDHVGIDRVATGALARPAMPKASAPAQYSELDIPASAEPKPETPHSRIPIDPPRILTAAERAQRRAEIEAAMAECLQQPDTPSLSRTLQQDGIYPAHITENGQAHITNQVGTTHVGTDAFVRPATAKPSAPTTTPAANVGTAAPGCPSGPGVSGRSGVVSSPTPNPKPAASTVPKKKPPLNVKHSPAPKERKNAAQRASAG